MRSMAILALASVLATPTWAEPPVWIARDADSEVVMFGSLHVLPAGLAWRPAVLETALQNADDLWFELSVDRATATETSQLAAASGFLVPGQSLFALLGPSDGARLTRLAAAYRIDAALLDRLKPWLAEVSLATAVYARAGATSDQGVEATLSAEAPPGVSRQAFETPEFQIRLFDETPLADQLSSLRATLFEIEAEPRTYEALVSAWMAGDVRALEQETAAVRRASPLLFRRLITERNARWTNILDARLKGAGRTVVVVGAGHLVGPGGVPARLRALGYSVTGP